MKTANAQRTFPVLNAKAEENGCPISHLFVTFGFSPATTRRGLGVITLFPGVVTEDAEEFFGYGFCTQLASAVHELTGWPYMAVWRGGDWLHLAVQTPSGDLLDITGVRPPEDAVRAYCADRVEPHTESEAMKIGMIGDPWDHKIHSAIVRETVRYFAAVLVRSTNWS